MSYDQYAQTFSKSRKNLHWPELGYIIADMRAHGSTSVLDIGCGNGRFIHEWINQVKSEKCKVKSISYLGIDSSRGMIDEAKRLHPEYDFEVCDMCSLSSLRDSNPPTLQPSKIPTLQPFDSLLLLASFHHLETHEARLGVLRDMRPLLRE